MKIDSRFYAKMSPMERGPRQSRRSGNLQVVGEFWHFLAERKKWWLTPVLVILLLFSILIVLTESSAIAPFIYTLF